MLSKGLLGKSKKWQALNASSPKEARLVLIALYALSIIPLTLIFKRWVTEVLYVIIGISFLLRSHMTRNWQWLYEPPVKIVIFLSAYLLLVVTPMAVLPEPSFTRAAIWWHYPLVFFAMVYWLADYREEVKHIVYVMAAIVFVICIDANVQYMTGESLSGIAQPPGRLTGPFTNPVVGIYMAKLGLPILGTILFYSWREHRNRAAWISFALVSFTTVTITISNERTALICYMVGLMLASGLIYWRLKSSRKLVCVLGVIQLILVAMLYFTQPSIQQRINQSTTQITSLADNPYAQLWKASFLIWKEHPFTGAGLLNFRSSCIKHLNSGDVLNCNLHSHNIYMEWLSEAGIIGFIGIILLIVSLFRMIIPYVKTARDENIILVGFAIAGLIPTFFPLAATQSFFSNWPAMLMWLSLGLSVGLVRNIRNE